MMLDPCGFCCKSPLVQAACPHAPFLLCPHKPRTLQDTDMLLHARQRHVEPVGEIRDGCIAAAKLLKHATPGRVGEGGE